MSTVMLAGRHTLLEQPALAEFLPLCVERGVSIVAAGVYNSGLLARPRPDASATYNYKQAPAELIARAHHLADVCERHGVSLPAAALQFPLRHLAVAAAVVGCRSPKQVSDTIERLNTPIPTQLWDEVP